jgi:DNA polymerase III subunit alpha, Gram-positive type
MADERVHKLFQEVNLPNEWLQTHFARAWIEKVLVDPQHPSWTIWLHLPEVIPAEVWHEFQLRLHTHFQPIQVKVQFFYEAVDHAVSLQKVKYWIQKQIQEKHAPAAAHWFGQSEWTVQGDQIQILFAHATMLEMARQRELDHHIAKYYQRITGEEVSVRLSAKETAPDEQLQKKHSQQEQALIDQAFIASSSNVADREIPPPEKKIGYPIQEEPRSIAHITEEESKVVVQGKVFKKEIRELKSGRHLFMFHLTDFTDSISCKIFAKDKEQAQRCARVEAGDWLKVRGNVQFDTFARDHVLMVNDFHEIRPVERMDTAVEKRVELHLHTSMSMMDGISSVKEVVKRAATWGHPAIAITDHGVAQAYPEAMDAGKKYGIKILYGVEANIVDDGVPIVMHADERSLQEETYVVFDVETTGLSVVHDVIIELAAVKMRQGQVVEKFSEFANPHRPLTQQIQDLTQITDEMVKDAPEIGDVIARFLHFIEGSTLVAHNARFDMGFLQAAIKRIGGEAVRNPVLDTLALARFLFPTLKNHRLNTLSDKLGVKLEQHHRALYDAEATSNILWKMIQEMVKRGVDQLAELNQQTGKRDLNRLRPFHVILLAKNQIGLKNLYKLISLSHLHYFYRVPRIPRSELIKHREGILIGSGCEKGELYETALNKSPEEVKAVAQFYDYLEIQPLDINLHLVEKGLVASTERLQETNRLLVQIGAELGKPVVATANVHYLDATDAIYRDIIVANAGGGSRQTGPLPKVTFRTTDEMLEEFRYLGEETAQAVVVTHPRALADQIEALKPIPDGTFTPKLEGSEQELTQLCVEKAHELYGDSLPEVIQTRLDRELGAIIQHGFSDLYMISQKIVAKSLSDGYLVGSRGSVGSSLVAFMSTISEVNPLPPHWRCASCKYSQFIVDGSYESGFDLPDQACPQCQTKMLKDGHDIPFETFLGFEADKTPDIDLNFGSDYQPRAHTFTEELLGKNYIFRAGTINTVQEKTAFGYVKKYAEQHNQSFRQAELERLVQGCVGVRRSTGQHPGGLMVVPHTHEIYDFSPVQRPADDAKSEVITTHFDYRSISGRILKLDILGHTGPTMLRMLQDVTGIDPTQVPCDDPKVLEIFRSTQPLGIQPEDINGITLGTLGIPEFGTYFARGILEDTRPTKVSELTRISGLSHGTDVWAGNAQDLIKAGTCTLSQAICCRDDIMLYLILKGLSAKSAFTIMEKVRKGKGVTEAEAQAMREHGVPEWYIQSCQKIKYMFPRAHAAAYVMMAVRIAWFKVYKPAEYYAASFTIRSKDCDIQFMRKGYEAVKKSVQEITHKGLDASAREKSLLTVLELVQEMYARAISLQSIDLYHSHADKFLVAEGKLIPSFASIAGVGENAAQNIVEARQAGEFLSVEDLQKRARLSSTVIDILKAMGCLQGLPESNQLSLF